MKNYSFSEPVARGSALDHTVACLFRAICKFEVIQQYRTGTSSPIDGAKLTADGYVKPNVHWPDGLLYECKFQDVKGTTYQKLAKTSVDIKAGAYGLPVLVIAEGRFFAKERPGIATVNWLKEQVDGKTLVGVLDMPSFISWCQRTGGASL